MTVRTFVDRDGNDYYVLLIPPDQWADLTKAWPPREHWQWAYRQWRKAGKPPMPLREIAQKYAMLVS